MKTYPLFDEKNNKVGMITLTDEMFRNVAVNFLFGTELVEMYEDDIIQSFTLVEMESRAPYE